MKAPIWVPRTLAHQWSDSRVRMLCWCEQYLALYPCLVREISSLFIFHLYKCVAFVFRYTIVLKFLCKAAIWSLKHVVIIKLLLYFKTFNYLRLLGKPGQKEVQVWYCISYYSILLWNANLMYISPIDKDCIIMFCTIIDSAHVFSKQSKPSSLLFNRVHECHFKLCCEGISVM